ncbi:amidase [Rahnella ecdela]|uniref:Amidase n=1 Tax=Rahnella ecdela TaxID=2816250 RepID=A0ABS6L9J0_9GAMM|nr:amidase [Rahnella ecdela]MBU9843608.1 amidase [Rahnella ecdela]
MKKITLSQAIQQLATLDISSRALTEAALAKSEDPQGEGSLVFTRLYHQQALELAVASDARRKEGKPFSALDGIPVSIKDLFDVAGESTTAGSKVLRDALVAAENATVVQKLLDAGVVIIGKTNMTEFAYSGLGINPHYGTPANPFDRATRRIPGGSSSGAAVSVSDGMSLGAIGSDTGGSVRIPAAFCGLTGYKPTARRISQTGLLPLSTALDTIGVITHDLVSCIALDGVIADIPVQITEKSLLQAHFAIPQTLVLNGLDADVQRAFTIAIEKLKQSGAKVSEIPCHEFSELADINATGGFTALESWAWHQNLIEQKGEQYDPRVVSRIRRGAALNQADLKRLELQRADWQQRVAQTIGQFDALLMPTVPMIAPSIAELEADDDTYFRANAAALRNPSVINFLDGCAVSLPCHQEGEAPVGLMVAALPLHDDALLSWSLQIERCLKAE